jgi:class 3 adenylate cyclase/tetratricopeptide (TPR) repeat protein
LLLNPRRPALTNADVASSTVRAPADRRVVTVLSADFARFTALAERHDPEETMAILDECFEALGNEIAERGGWIEKYIGDEILAIFGAPVAQEDAPLRALDAALALHERMQSLNRALAGRLDEPILLHIGVSTGLVIWGPGPMGDYRAIGDPVVVCARLRDAAKPGQVLVNRETYVAAQGNFEFQEVGSLALKGKSQPVQAFACLSPGHEGGRHRDFRSPLVGREQELAVFQGLVEQLDAGQGSMVGLSGEAGVGKSRLLDELRPFAAARRAVWLHGETVSYGRSITYWPFQQMVRAFVGIRDGEPEAQSLVRLRSAVERRFGPHEAVEIIPYLATLLAIDPGAALVDRVRYLDSEALRGQIFRSMRLFVERLARASPVVLIIDDVQWIDDASSRLVEHLLPLARQLPVLICLASRRETSPAALEATVAETEAAVGEALLGRIRVTHPDLREIVLEPLNSSEAAALVRNLVGLEEASLDRLVTSRAEGNPFFIEEVLLSLIDARALVRDSQGNGWEVGSLEHIEVPASLQNLILARLDRLAPDARRILDAACVLGRRFSAPVLRAVLYAHPAIDDCLQELVSAELLERTQDGPEPDYAFRHAMIQEAAYSRLLMRTRAELHHQVAIAIEAVFPDRLSELAAVLAHHYALAQDWPKAQEYLFRAGDQAGRLAADVEALGHYEDAMRIYQRGTGGRWDNVERAALLRRIGEAHFRSGAHDEAMDQFSRGLVELRCPYPRSQRRTVAALAREIVVQAGHRGLPFRLPRPRPTDEYVQERARFYFTMTWVDYFAGRQFELLLGCLFQANFCERRGYGEGMVLGYGGLGIVCDLIPLRRLAGWYHHRAAELAESLGHPPSLALAALGLSYHYHMLGDWDAALEHYARARRLYDEIGDLRRAAAMIYSIAWIRRLQGGLQESRRLAEELVRLGEEGDDRQTAAWGYHALGRVQCVTGELASAEFNLGHAIGLAEAAQDFQTRAPAMADLAECLLRQGKIGNALAVAKQGANIARDRSQRDFLNSQVRYGLALAYLTAAERQRGARRIVELNAARKAVKSAQQHAGIAQNGLPAAYRLRGTAEWLAGRKGSAESWWQKAEQIAHQMGARLDEALTLSEMGIRIPDHDRAKRGAAMLAEMGAMPLLGDCR